MRYTLKPPKGTQPFKYMIAQFRCNMELTLVGGCNGLHKHRRNWDRRRDLNAHKAVLETAAQPLYHVYINSGLLPARQITDIIGTPVVRPAPLRNLKLVGVSGIDPDSCRLQRHVSTCFTKLPKWWTWKESNLQYKVRSFA